MRTALPLIVNTCLVNVKAMSRDDERGAGEGCSGRQNQVKQKRVKSEEQSYTRHSTCQLRGLAREPRPPTSAYSA